MPTEYLLTIAEIAAQLGVPFYRVRYIVQARSIESMRRVGGIRMFDLAAVRLITREIKAIQERRVAVTT